jgi:glycosyltransferase involved in cell wall biosynthesis
MVRERYGARRVTTVANAAWPPRPTEAVERDYDLVFVGNLSYQPNIDAARWLCEEIRPLLGGVTIAIVGSQPRSEVGALAELPGVTVAPDVPEVAPWYARSRVAVAPLRVGGGTRIKILEALAHERPVVATPLGAAGLEVGEDYGVLIAATAEDFAASCRRLLADASATTRIAAAGSRQVRTAEQIAGEVDLLTSAVLEDRSMAARVEHVAH